MAQLKTPLNILRNGTKYPGHVIQEGIGYFNSEGLGTFIHIKTNVLASAETMVKIEAVGYAYGGSQAIRCSWAWHTTGGTLYKLAYQTVYPGLSPQLIYISGDNYICLRGAAPNYFIGFMLNATTAGPDNITGGYGMPVGIISVVGNSTSGQHF